MSNIDFYYFVVSPYCRSVLYAAEVLDVKLNKKVINLLKGEQKNEEFVKLNPHHKVPTLVDGDFVLGESRSILTYLFNKYGKSKHEYLYPKDLKKRAKIEQFLYYTATTVAPAVLGYFAGIFFGKRKPTEEETTKLETALNDLDKIYFQNSPFIFGDKPTLADFDLAPVILHLELLKYDYSKYPGISKFIAAVKKSDWITDTELEFKQTAEALMKDFKPSA
ncbi:DgyrCDS6431 [Dimorphilus gyrociliatus]|uniref:DgyrCDS6431 n=1 Tax=Dimorphilus gyrociliatus TaxID=2664684 RepID=A0A7I8VN17_9ANNE|nr:DgyrCDS6431 [Dimorphilus gyrociliatus]